MKAEVGKTRSKDVEQDTPGLECFGALETNILTESKPS